MSKRKRSLNKQSEIPQIEWLKHRTGYPAPEEREEIIRMRKEINFEVIKLMVRNAPPEDPRFQALARKYGADEIERASRSISDSVDMPSRVANDATSYRDYRLRYSRYGAGLKFYSNQETDDLYKNNLDQFKGLLGNDSPGSFTSNLDQILLLGWRDWEDITPLAIPPRPADFAAPVPASYPSPIAELLDYGDDIDKPLNFGNETGRQQWKKQVPALTRMALDPGLINGWPAEPASWAPWHAIHALSILQAFDSAPALAQLADLENDWLTDHLPHIWADMGAGVEPSLWMILEDAAASKKQRGLAAEGLYMMADDNSVVESKVVKGFEKLLQNAKTFDPTVNGYLIAFLDKLDIDDGTQNIINSAFAEGRVDLHIINPEDLEYDEDDLDNESEDEE